MELMFTIAVCFPLCAILIIPLMFAEVKRSDNGSYSMIDLLGMIPFALTLFVVVNKDFFRGRSVVKRFLGYQILNVNTQTAASPLRCMLRNITSIIWPVEALIALFNPRRRLGDYIAGTIVVKDNCTDPETILEDIDDPASYKGITKLLIYSTGVIFGQCAIGLSDKHVTTLACLSREDRL